MGLRIQNNITALNAHRQLTISDNGLSKSLERLSSGYRINRAADDAAGLSISQSFRADIASFKVATRNASEANSLLQVAEGALDQIGNMLTRLKELATQASSGNAASNLDKIDAEAQKLISEIDRIAEGTEYADTKLINGTYGVDVAGQAAALSGGVGFAGATGLAVDETYTLATDYSGASGTPSTITLSTADTEQKVYIQAGAPSGENTWEVEFDALGVTLTVNSSFTDGCDGAFTAASSGSSTFQVGAENDAHNRISISLGNATKGELGKAGVGTVAISAIDLLSQNSAKSAMDIVDYAINDLAAVRGDIGAAQNRLSYASANLSVTIENVTSAESVIRDVDMAAEMVSFTKYQILQQAGTAMLAQANMAPQSVLSLFS